MKKLVIIFLACLLATCAFAADKSITILNKASFNGQTLTPGDYKVNYEIKGSTAQVKMILAGKTVATATGEVVEMKDASPYTGLLYKNNADGSRTVVEIQLEKQKQVIRLNSEGTAVGK